MPTPDSGNRQSASVWSGSLKRWSLRLVAVCCGVAMTECVLMVAGWISPRVAYCLDPPWKRSLVRDPELGYRMSPHYPGNDRLGFRNQAVLARCDLLVVGASMTYGFAATRELAWPSQLAEATGKTIYNMSCGGYGPCEFEVLVKRGLKLEPSTVLVEIYPGNDLADAYGSVYLDGRFPELHCGDAALCKVFSDADASRPIANLMAKYGGRSKASGQSLQDWFAENSSLYGLGRAVRETLIGRQYRSALREDVDASDEFENAALRPDRLKFAAAEHLRTVFLPPGRLARACDPSDPRIREGRRIMEDRLLSMQSHVRSAGAHLVVVLLPSKAVVYAPTVRHHDTALAAGFSALVEQEEQVALDTTSFLRERRIDFVDVTPALRAGLERGERLYPESDDEHLNGAGYGVLAGAVAAALQPPTEPAIE